MANECRLCGFDACSCGPCIGCGFNPCSCGSQAFMNTKVNLDPNCCTVCTGDTECNIWFEPGPPGYPGKCKLDLMTYEQVHRVLQRVPYAKAQLLKITSDECLIRLANNTKLIVPPQEASQLVERRLNANTIPYYTVLRGNTDGTPR